MCFPDGQVHKAAIDHIAGEVPEVQMHSLPSGR
jgi:hypothetical protein